MCDNLTMIKILVLRADEIRHRALVSKLARDGFQVFQVVQPKVPVANDVSSLISNHFNARNQFEMDYFRYLQFSETDSQGTIHSSSLDSVEVQEFAREISPEYIITFGCAILKKNWVENFANKILGIHLGLSPYYRGSGTNFFPFVNNELGAIGFTLMNLDSGVDTGNIVHQRYAEIVQGDSIHSIGNRLLQCMFEDISRLVHRRVKLSEGIKQPESIVARVYKKRDFTEVSLLKALENLRTGAVDCFLMNEAIERQKFPLLRVLQT